MTPRFRKLGPALRRIRERRSSSQGDIAQRAGVSVSVVSRIETGHHRPTLDLLDRILGALEADVLELGLALGVVEGCPAVQLSLPEGLSASERGALAVSFFGFQEFVRAAAERSAPRTAAGTRSSGPGEPA